MSNFFLVSDKDARDRYTYLAECWGYKRTDIDKASKEVFNTRNTKTQVDFELAIINHLHSKPRPEYVTCVRDLPTTAHCQRHIYGFAFDSPEHARLNEANGGRLTTCPQCQNVIRRKMNEFIKTKTDQNQQLDYPVP